MPRQSKDKIFVNLDAAAGALHLDPDTLRKLKEKGCPAFRANGSVSRNELFDFISANPDAMPKGKSTKEQIEEEKLREIRMKNDVRADKLVQRVEVAKHHSLIFGQAMARCEQLLTNEYPSVVIGLDAPNARVYGKRVFDLILEAHREAAQKWEL